MKLTIEFPGVENKCCGVYRTLCLMNLNAESISYRSFKIAFPILIRMGSCRHVGGKVTTVNQKSSIVFTILVNCKKSTGLVM